MSQELFALIDCNNFYVSCERVFQPALEKMPVMVLSNNDGCVIARSEEVKRLGVTMGMPLFKCDQLIDEHNITWFSSNYPLYGDMSQRVMQTLYELAPQVETYSIDEAFIKLPNDGRQEEYARQIRETIRRWVGIPVSIGIAPTKVLAKIANQIAKKNPEHAGVFDLSTKDADSYLKNFDVADVWGVGRQYARWLKRERVEERVPEQMKFRFLDDAPPPAKIDTALKLKYADERYIRAKMTVQGARIVYELRGISCLPLEAFEKPRKAIAATRSFGRPVTDIKELRQAVATYITRGAERMRKRHLAASYLRVFIHTSRFAPDPFYASKGAPLLAQTSYTPELIENAERLLEGICESGHRYSKAGIMFEDLVPEESAQMCALRSIDYAKRERLMEAVDTINRANGRGTIRSAAIGFKNEWQMKQGRRSQRYTTQWNELAVARAV